MSDDYVGHQPRKLTNPQGEAPQHNFHHFDPSRGAPERYVDPREIMLSYNPLHTTAACDYNPGEEGQSDQPFANPTALRASDNPHVAISRSQYETSPEILIPDFLGRPLAKDSHSTHLHPETAAGQQAQHEHPQHPAPQHSPGPIRRQRSTGSRGGRPRRNAGHSRNNSRQRTEEVMNPEKAAAQAIAKTEAMVNRQKETIARKEAELEVLRAERFEHENTGSARDDLEKRITNLTAGISTHRATLRKRERKLADLMKDQA